MSAIPYRWTCHACKAGNEAGTSACAQCGVGALASVAQIEGRPAAPPPPDPRLYAGPWPLHLHALHAMSYMALPVFAGVNDEMGWMREGWAVLLGVLATIGLVWLSRPALERVRRKNARLLAQGVPLAHLPDNTVPPHVWLLLVLCALAGLGMWALFHYTRYHHLYWLGLVPIALMLGTADKEMRLARQAQRIAAAEALPDER